MTLTIDMPDEVAERARAAARFRGLDLNAYAILLFRSDSLGMPVTAGNKEASGPLPWDEFAARMIEGVDPNRPPLPDYALSRESIYED